MPVAPSPSSPPRASQAAAARCHVTRADRDGGRARTPRPESPLQQREQRGPVFWLPHASPTSASHRAARWEVSQRQPGPRAPTSTPRSRSGQRGAQAVPVQPGQRAPAPVRQPRPSCSRHPGSYHLEPLLLSRQQPALGPALCCSFTETLEGKLRQRAGVSAQHLRRGPVRTAGFGVLVLWGDSYGSAEPGPLEALPARHLEGGTWGTPCPRDLCLCGRNRAGRRPSPHPVRSPAGRAPPGLAAVTGQASEPARGQAPGPLGPGRGAGWTV